MTTPMIQSLDHLVLTVADIPATIAFYTRHLGMRHVTFEGRHGIAFGNQKINLHQAGVEFEPKSRVPTPGSGDLCFLVSEPVAALMERLTAEGIEIIEGPVPRTGATGALNSIYLRDPDGNLIELANPV